MSLVYKYRSGSDDTFERDLDSLVKNYFWASSFDKLNDPCEAIIYAVAQCNGEKSQLPSNSITLVDVEVISKDGDKEVTEKPYAAFSEISYKFDMGVKNPNDYNRVGLFSVKQMKHLLKVVNELYESKRKHIESYEHLLTLIQEFGIYSLSKCFDNELLWAHYSDSHRGFCIGFDFKTLKKFNSFKYYSLPVKYLTNPPVTKIGDPIETRLEFKNFFTNRISTKSKKWLYEKEVRIITEKWGMHSYVPEAVKSIYFGLRMTDEKKHKIITSLKDRFIKFHQMQLEENTYKLIAH